MISDMKPAGSYRRINMCLSGTCRQELRQSGPLVGKVVLLSASICERSLVPESGGSQIGRESLALSLLILILILAFGGAVLAQDKTLYWQRYDVDLSPQTNGDLHVEETQELVFTNGTSATAGSDPAEPAGRD